MLINKDWKIESDDLCVTLSMRKDKTPTEKDSRIEYWVPVSFCNSLEDGLKEYAKKAVYKTKLESVEIILAKLEEVKLEIQSLNIIKGINEVNDLCNIKSNQEK